MSAPSPNADRSAGEGLESRQHSEPLHPTTMIRLYTFNISHFSEKVRWTLDYEGIPYEERVLLPGPHQLVTRRIAPRTHVPVLEHDGQYVQGSSAIIDYVADRLGGTKLSAIDSTERVKALEVEKKLDQVFGRGVQQVLYSALLKDRRTVTDLWSFGGPFWARGFYGVAFPAIASAVKRMYKTTDVEGVARAKQRFAAAFDELDAVLAKQPYLGGDTPNRTDITLAALLAPVCRVPGHRIKWPEMPPELADVEASLCGRPTWNHVFRMYRDHRKPKGPGAAGAQLNR
jgi:glutathione S-transferase